MFEATDLLPCELWLYIIKIDFKTFLILTKTFKSFNVYVKNNFNAIREIFTKICVYGNEGIEWMIGEDYDRRDYLPTVIWKSYILWRNFKKRPIDKPNLIDPEMTMRFDERKLRELHNHGDYKFVRNFVGSEVLRVKKKGFCFIKKEKNLRSYFNINIWGIYWTHYIVATTMRFVVYPYFRRDRPDRMEGSGIIGYTKNPFRENLPKVLHQDGSFSIL